KIAQGRGAGIAFDTALIDQITTELVEHDVGLLVVDPFISSHAVGENDNSLVDAVAKQWAAIADRANCAVEIVHHVRKPAQGQDELTVDDARGAGALVNAARSARVLNRMTSKQAEQAGVDDRRLFFRTDTGKANLAPPETATWFRLVSVTLP